MTRLFFALLLAAPFSYTQAQKEDNVWATAYRYSFDTISNRIFFTFGDSLQISYTKRPMSFAGVSASICDSLGNLLIYSNGCYVETAAGHEIEGSEGMNPGLLYDLSCADNEGYRLDQSMVLLPDPGNPALFHFFHMPLVTPLYVINLLHTVVDMSANNGNGTTVFKNQVVAADTIHEHGLHAVRHANGRDWWVIAAKKFSNRYYLILLTPYGVEAKYQEIGSVDTGIVYGGEMVFSPDGTKLARFDTQDDLRLFDFDRCTGTLSNPLHISIQDNADIAILAGLGWSADSRFIYAAEDRRLLQFDTWANDIGGSKVIIAEADPPLCPLSGSIGIMELGPDGMIYCRPFNGQNCLHRIKHPERAGLACEFQQNYFQLEYPFADLPNFPNFRLGPLDGSPCDTLGLDNRPLAGWRYDASSMTTNGVDFTSVSWYEPTDWLWDFDDLASGASNQNTERNPSHTFSAPGGYEVCLTVSNQYGSDEKCKTVWVSTVDTGAPNENEQMKIYPNPTTGEVFLSVSGEVLVRVFNNIGQLQMEKAVSDNRLDLSQLQPGVYRLQLFREGEMLTTQNVILLNR
jgi:hypothetical protein